MSDDFAYLSVTELVTEFAAGRVSPVDAIAAGWRRIGECEETLNALCYLADEDETLAAARDSEARWARGEPVGRLDGVPFTVKDAILAKGWPTMRGSRTTDPDQSWDEDAPAVARVREHGAILLGKTTTPELGWKTVTDSPLCGITRNPWNPDMTPGGSSGGSAAALAAGIGQFSIGTDAGGSVRLPCSFTGLVGLKASAGRIPVYPPSSAGTAGHIGPMTRTVTDSALLLNVMSGPDDRDWLALPRDGADYRDGLDDGIKGLRVAFSPTLGFAKVDAEIAEFVARAAREFENLGATVEEVEAPLPDATDCFRTHFFTGVAHALGGLSPDKMAMLDPGLADVIHRGREIDVSQYLANADTRVALGRAGRMFHRNYDVLLTPTVAVAPFPVGRDCPDGYDTGDWLGWAPFTYPFNLTGQPALTVPCGFTAAGLPVGLQIVGAMYADALVLRAGRAYEAAHPTTDRRPPV